MEPTHENTRRTTLEDSYLRHTWLQIEVMSEGSATLPIGLPCEGHNHQVW